MPIRFLRYCIELILVDVLTVEDKNKIINLLEEKEEKDMEEWIKRIKKNDEKYRRQLINEGRKEGKTIELLKTIKNMLKFGEPEEKIKMYTNATNAQIEQGKKELGLI